MRHGLNVLAPTRGRRRFCLTTWVGAIGSMLLYIGRGRCEVRNSRDATILYVSAGPLCCFVILLANDNSIYAL